MAELEVSFDTVRAEYYRKPNPQVLLDGARVGIVSYLRSRGVAAPVLAYPHATGVYAHDLHELDNEVYEAFRRYGSVIDLHAMVQRTITGELAALNDPYTVFFVPREYHEFVSSLSGRPIGGIGVVIDYKGGVALIDHVIAKSPAAQAGLRTGDRIVSVDGVALGTLDASAVADHLRGPVGSTARLEIVRDGATQTVAVVRAEVRQPDVDARMLAGDVGYIALAAYGEDSAHELNDALHDLAGRGARAYVLDLRDNGGGYAQQSQSRSPRSSSEPGPCSRCSGAAAAARPTTRRRARHGTDRSPCSSTATPRPLRRSPRRRSRTIAPGRSSASGRSAKAWRSRSSCCPSGGAMKMTTERYFTAGGHDIDRKGIEPDVVVAEPAGAVRGVVGQDPQLDRALALLAPAAPAASPSPSPVAAAMALRVFMSTGEASGEMSAVALAGAMRALRAGDRVRRHRRRSHARGRLRTQRRHPRLGQHGTARGDPQDPAAVREDVAPRAGVARRSARPDRVGRLRRIQPPARQDAPAARAPRSDFVLLPAERVARQARAGARGRALDDTVDRVRAPARLLSGRSASRSPTSAIPLVSSIAARPRRAAAAGRRRDRRAPAGKPARRGASAISTGSCRRSRCCAQSVRGSWAASAPPTGTWNV